MVLDILWLIIGGAYVAGKVTREKRDERWFEQHPYGCTDQRFNPRRQNELEQMCILHREEIAKMLGRPFDGATVKQRKDAVVELLAKEGYEYYDYVKANAAWLARKNRWRL